MADDTHITDELYDAIERATPERARRVIERAITEIERRDEILNLLWDFALDRLGEFEAGLNYDEREIVREHFGLTADEGRDPFEDLHDLWPELDEDDAFGDD